jgi:hypothetical protein
MVPFRQITTGRTVVIRQKEPIPVIYHNNIDIEKEHWQDAPMHQTHSMTASELI